MASFTQIKADQRRHFEATERKMEKPSEQPHVETEAVQVQVEHVDAILNPNNAVELDKSNCCTSSGPCKAAVQGRRSTFNTNSSHAPLKILIGSWNVGNAMPPKNSKIIHEWIPEGGGGFDVIAIGLQESSYRERPDSSTNGDSVKGDESENDDDLATDIIGSNGDDDGETELDEAMEIARENARENNSPRSRSPRRPSATNKDSNVEVVSAENAGSTGNILAGEDINTNISKNMTAKKSRAKKSMRKVSKLVRDMSTNLRDSVADALDYPFNKQLYYHLGNKYSLVGKVELMEMRLFIYVHQRHTVTEIEKLSIPTGLGSVLGNKGGLIFKFVIENTSLCFVSCHLAAHQDQKFLDKRNSDCSTILGTQFGRKNVTLDHQFDHSFWFGDLNYRVDLSYTTPQERTHDQHYAEVLACVKAKKWAFLNANDQLKHQIELKRALLGWELPPALFPPTFKRVRHTSDQYNPQRVPSYCDRVLHTSLPGLRSNLKLKKFASIDAIATSDHKPVFAQFHVVPTPVVNVDPLLTAGRTTLVEFIDLAAQDLLGMDITGLSDPYIKFYSVPDNALQVEASGSHPSTAIITNTLSPMWHDNQVPRLHVLCDQERDIKHVHLILLLMDHDTTSKDDVLGVVVLSLEGFCVGKPNFLPFESQVVRHGKAAGTLRGKIRVMLPHQAELSPCNVDQQPNTISTCHCNIS